MLVRLQKCQGKEMNNNVSKPKKIESMNIYNTYI